MVAPAEAAALDRRSFTIVADALELRRAALSQLMQDWARARQMEILPVDPSLDDLAVQDGRSCALVLFNLGCASVTQPESAEWLKRAKERFPAAPLAIVSDRDDAEEVICAFRSGVQGFIPSRTPPDMALQAMSFIVSGGSFFPPGALLRPPRRRPDRESRTKRQPPNFTLVHVSKEQDVPPRGPGRK